MAISKENVVALFSVGDIVGDEASNNALHITAINDDHIVVLAPSSGPDEIKLAYSALSETVDALYNSEGDDKLPLHRLADEYIERHEDAIDEMWRRAGACQLP